MKFVGQEPAVACRPSALARRARRWRGATAVVVVSAALTGVARARADEPPPVRVAIDRPGDLPFSSAELYAAIDARLMVAQAPGGAAVPVRIAPGGAPGRVQVVADSSSVDVTIAGKPAPEAARLVALAVVDVVRAAPRPPVATVATAQDGGGASGGGAPPAGASVAARLAVAVYPGASVGLGGASITFEPTVDLTCRLGGAGSRLRLGLSAGYARTSAPWMNQSLTLSTLPVRLGPRVRWRWLDAGAGGSARLYDTAGLDGGRGAMLGGYASVGASGPLGHGVRWSVVAVGDVFSEKIVFRAAGSSVLSAGPFIFWLGAGASFGGGAS